MPSVEDFFNNNMSQTPDLNGVVTEEPNFSIELPNWVTQDMIDGAINGTGTID